MNVSVNLTGSLFNDYHGIDFYDSKTIFFDATTFLPSTVSFAVWGANVMPGFNWENYADVTKLPKIQAALKKHTFQSITIQGFGTLTFTDVVAGRLSATMLDGKEFLMNSRGRRVELVREWNLDAVDSGCHEYIIDEANLYFPHAACELRLYAKGPVRFTFDADDCVDSVDYITNPDRRESFYGYLKNKALITNSYCYEEIDPLQTS